ncbi:MAG: HAD-IIIA family hydrolase [Bacteroidota bacterium]
MIPAGKNIRILRKRLKIDLQELARRAGIGEGIIVQIENNILMPDCEQIVKLAAALDYPVGRILTEDLEKSGELLSGFDFKMLALDIDGVLTDGGMFVTQTGDEFKKFNAKDGLAIKTLTASGIPVAFISSGINGKIIESRAALLGVQKVYVGTWKKLEVLQKWCSEMNIHLENVAYIGDDINDLTVIQNVGLSACPSDAVPAVKAAVSLILSTKGGKGCVREFIDTYIAETK